MYYKPYWFCEFHLGLEKHVAVLDATNSEIKIDPNVLLKSMKQDPIPFEELKLDERKGFKKENLLFAKINKQDEASNLIKYKLKYIYPDKDLFLEKPHLRNISVWVFKFQEKTLTVFGNDTNYKETILKFLKTNTTSKEKTKTQLFAETIGQIKKPKSIFDDFIDVIKTTNKWVLVVTLIVIILIIYFIVSKIIENISTGI